MGFATLLIFPFLAWLVTWFAGTSFLSIFAIRQDQLYSIPTFLSAGILFGIAIIWVTELPYFDKPLSRYRHLLANLKISRFQAVFLSFCAGFGEEVFFRGAIQPYAGIVLTSLFFVAIHGYFSMQNAAVNVFAAALTLFIILLGWAAREFSIWHAIAGHFSYDLVLLMYHRRTSRTF